MYLSAFAAEAVGQSGGRSGGQSDAQTGALSADALYSDRSNLSSARRAAALWEADAAQNRAAFEPAWKLARVCYWLGGHAPDEERRALLERGIAASRRAAAISPGAPEGHFWLAANMGALAESFGLRAGLKYRKPIKDALETVRRISPSFMDGSADRALGRWYFKVPRLFGGSDARAIEYLRASLTYNNQSTISLFFLAEVLAAEGQKAEARATLQRVLDAPLDPAWVPEDQEYKLKAIALLASLK